MERLTKKFADNVMLPMIPMEINSKEDLEEYHRVRKEYEDYAVKLASYEDIGSVEDIESLIEENKALKKLQSGLLNIFKMQVDMFDGAKEEDGVHTLTCSHESLIKLKNKLNEIINESSK